MQFFNSIRNAFSSYSDAISFINKNRMYAYFIWPLIIYFVLFLLGFTGASYLTNILIEFLKSFLTERPEAWYNSEIIHGLLSITIWIILRLFFFFAFAYIGGYLVLILLSPILSFVAAKTTDKLCNKITPFSSTQILKDIFRGIVIAFRNFFYQLLLTIALFILGFIPLLGWFSPFLLLGVSSYFYGISFIDYALESKQLNYKKSLDFIQKNKFLSFGIGLPYVLFLMIPFIGLILAGFFAIISTISSCILIHKKQINQLNDKKYFI